AGGSDRALPEGRPTVRPAPTSSVAASLTGKMTSDLKEIPGAQKLPRAYRAQPGGVSDGEEKRPRRRAEIGGRRGIEKLWRASAEFGPPKPIQIRMVLVSRPEGAHSLRSAPQKKTIAPRDARAG